jgi:putative methyltransferase
MAHKDTLSSALDRICAKRKVSSVEDLLGKKTTGILPSYLLLL